MFRVTREDKSIKVEAVEAGDQSLLPGLEELLKSRALHDWLVKLKHLVDAEASEALDGK